MSERRCRDCNDAPQETLYGLCESCRVGRIERVRASLHADDGDEDADTDDDGQATLAGFD